MIGALITDFTPSPCKYNIRNSAENEKIFSKTDEKPIL